MFAFSVLPNGFCPSPPPHFIVHKTAGNTGRPTAPRHERSFVRQQRSAPHSHSRISVHFPFLAAVPRRISASSQPPAAPKCRLCAKASGDPARSWNGLRRAPRPLSGLNLSSVHLQKFHVALSGSFGAASTSTRGPSQGWIAPIVMGNGLFGFAHPSSV